ncbi:MAG: hypothetical protein E7166_00475 [Firmicutes bacterium]|nr:hypothetical protein [Bacillota bacterium]
MLEGIIYLIFFGIGLYCGLKLEFKDKDKFIDDIVDEVVDETVTEIFESKNTSQEQTEGTQYPNELTPEIIDEWMNGAGDNK